MAWVLIAAGALFVLAAVAKAAVDILTHQEGNNVFEAWGPWFDARTSWKRKYKNYDPMQGPRFWGSTTGLVALTDFWHAADAVYLVAYLAGGLLLGLCLAGRPWWWLLVAGALVKLGFGCMFELCYGRWFRKI